MDGLCLSCSTFKSPSAPCLHIQTPGIGGEKRQKKKGASILGLLYSAEYLLYHQMRGNGSPSIILCLPISECLFHALHPSPDTLSILSFRNHECICHRRPGCPGFKGSSMSIGVKTQYYESGLRERVQTVMHVCRYFSMDKGSSIKLQQRTRSISTLHSMSMGKERENKKI